MSPICVNARFVTQHPTGVQRFATKISAELVKLRSDVVLLAPRRPHTTDELDQFSVHPIGRSAGHLWEQTDLPRYLARHGDPLLLNLGSTAPANYKNQISTHHDITYVKHPESFSRTFRLLYSILIPRVIQHSKALITGSEFSRIEIAQHFGLDPVRFTVVPSAADVRFTIPTADVGPPHHRPYLLAVSSPNAHKNFGRLIEAFGYFSQEHPGVDLLVVGKQARPFRAQTYNVRRSETIRFLGSVDDDTLVRLYQGSIALVFPSLYEGFGIPPLEAQQCGCPVIASHMASLPEVLLESAMYFDPYDARDIARAMSQVTDNPQLRASLVRAGLENARRFSWRDSAQAVSDLVDRVRQQSGGY